MKPIGLLISRHLHPSNDSKRCPRSLSWGAKYNKWTQVWHTLTTMGLSKRLGQIATTTPKHTVIVDLSRGLIYSGSVSLKGDFELQDLKTSFPWLHMFICSQKSYRGPFLVLISKHLLSYYPVKEQYALKNTDSPLVPPVHPCLQTHLVSPSISNPQSLKRNK